LFLLILIYFANKYQDDVKGASCNFFTRVEKNIDVENLLHCTSNLLEVNLSKVLNSYIIYSIKLKSVRNVCYY